MNTNNGLVFKKYEYLKFKKSIIEEYLLLQEKYSKIYNKDKTIVLMQVGGFHEAYATDKRGYNLHKLSEILNTIVSKKNKKNPDLSEKNPYMLGFPLVATPKYVQILVNNDFHVIKIDQVTNPPNPKRAVTGIYSPGTYIDDINSHDSKNILSIFIEEIKQLNNSYILYIGLSIVDLSVGNSIIHETFATKDDDKYALDETLKFIYNFNPSETVIYYKNLVTYTEDELLLYLELKNKNHLIYKFDDNSLLNINYQNNFLKSIFNLESYLSPIEELDLEKMTNGRISYILLLNYCKKQISDILLNIRKPEFYDNLNYLHLGNNALNQLNIVNNNSDKNEALFDIINFTNTSMGRRLLKFNLCNPLCDNKIIEGRYEKIEDLKNKEIDLSDRLKNIIDIERLHRKISLQTLNPCDFVNLHDSYEVILKLYNDVKNTKLSEIFNKKLKLELESFIKYYNEIFDFNEMSKYILNDISGSFYKKDINSEIDNLQNLIDNQYNLIEDLRDSLEVFIDNNKKKDYFNSFNEDKSMIQIHYNDKDKYYSSLTTKRSDMVKKELKKRKFIIVNDIKVRFEDINFKKQASSTKITSELIDKISDKITVAADKLKPLVKETYQNHLLYFYNNFSNLFLQLNNTVANIDFINSGCLCSIKNKYHKPIISEYKNSFIDAKKLRHPIIEKIIFTEYIPHDIQIGKEEIGILLYGLNAAGKSSLMKAIGLNIILAQIGYFVAADNFKYKPYSSIFTRIVNTDNLHKGLSAFALELVELKAILKRSGSNTLVLADEVCNGTEYKSALIIVASMIKMLVDSNTSFVSATHLHELVNLDIISKLDNIGIYHINVKYENDNIIFVRDLKKGNGREEYGLDFAKYIIKDSSFLEISNIVKSDIENEPDIKKSRYNKNLIVSKCDICESKDNLETHHIEFQKNTDKYGFILNEDKNHIHKDHMSNLVVLCSKCHDKIHNNLIVINGYEETAKGNILNFEIVKKKSKKKNGKYSDHDIEYINSYKDQKNITLVKVKKYFKRDKQRSISTSTISKIWKNLY